MNDGRDEELESTTVDLNYEIYTDDSGLTAYVKFEGFRNTQEVKEFADFMEEHLPLLLFNSDVRH